MISGTRTERLIDKLSEEAFKAGRRPTNDDLIRELRKFQDILDSTKPSMRFRPFGFRQRLDLGQINLMEGEIADDLDYLYEEQVAQVIRVLQILNRSDIIFRATDRQLRILEALVQDIALTSKNAAAVLFAVTDTLVDSRNIDQANTTVCLDFVTGVATLPANASGVKRIVLPHLVSSTAWPIIVRASDGSVLAETRAIQSDGRNPVGVHISPFGQGFDDLITAWQFTVTRNVVDPTTIEFTIPIVAPSSPIRETQVGRIDIDPSVSSPIELQVLTSLDNVNFKYLPGHAVPKIIDTPTTFRFPEVTLEFIKVVMTKTRADVILDDGRAVYTFGMKNFAAFTMGYAPQAVLQTVPLQPQDSSGLVGINKVTLSADEEIEDGTEIDYFVALDQATPEFFQLSNIQRVVPGAPQVLSFTDVFESPRNENRFQVVSTPTVFRTRNGINFLEILSGLRSGIQFRSARLYRGVNGWSKQVETLIIEESITNEVKFDRDANIPLYLLAKNEEATILVATPATTILGLRNEILGSISRTPATGPTGARTPNYAIERVIHHPTPTPQVGIVNVVRLIPPIPTDPLTKIEIELTGSLDIRVGDLINITDPATGTVWPNLEVVADSATTGSTTQLILVVPENTDAPPVDIDAGDLTIIRRDATRFVQEFKGTTVTLAPVLTVESGDRFEVTYRYAFGSNHDIITTGVRVTDGTQTNDPFVNGVDYFLDPLRKTITRIPTGAIADQATVIIEVPYRERRPGREIYTTYVRVGTPTSVELPGLTLDEEIRESATITIDQDLIDLSKAGPLTLTRGIHQVRVFSRPLLDPASQVQRNSSIFKVVNMVTVGGKALFARERFFQTQDAFIEPMTQISLTQLIGSVRKTDHGFFAIEAGKVIINYNPTTANEILYLRPGQAAPDVREDFELAYRFVPSTPVTDKVLLKVVLRREDQFPARTPVLKSFSLRFS